MREFGRVRPCRKDLLKEPCELYAESNRSTNVPSRFVLYVRDLLEIHSSLRLHLDDGMLTGQDKGLSPISDSDDLTRG